MVKAIKAKDGERVTNRVAWRILSGDGQFTDLLLREEMRRMRTRNWLPGQRFKSLSCQAATREGRRKYSKGNAHRSF